MLTPENVLSFLLTLFRISIILFLLPFYGSDSLPAIVKAALCMVLTLALFPHLKVDGALFPSHPFNIAIMLLGEVILGLILGMVVNIVFAAIQGAGELIGFQMGFSMVSVVDPMTGQNESVTTHFLYMVTMLTFLALNGHLMLLHALAQTFELVPPGALLITPPLAGEVLEFSKELFVLAIKVASPVMASLFLVDLGLALVARAAPQMNVLLIGFPLKISVGFFFLAMLFTIMSEYIQDFIARFEPMFSGMLRMAT